MCNLYKGGVFMANNPHSKAVSKYNEKTYKTFSVNPKIPEYERLEFLSARCGVGKSNILISMLNQLSDAQIEELVKKENHSDEDSE